MGRLVFSICPFPDESADVNPGWCQSVQPFDSFSRLLNVWPLKPPSTPLCLEGQFVWRISIPRWICTYVPNVVPIGPAVWQLQHSFEFVTPKIPPAILRDELYLAYVHSQTNPQTCTKFGANQSSCLTASPYCDPPKTPWGIEGRFVYPFPDESTYLYHICCQSVQPFDSFPKHLNLWLPNPPPPQMSLVYCGANCI